MGFVIIAVLVVIFLILWATIDIVPQAEARVIERLGVFHAVWGAGLHLKIPVIDRAVVPHIDLREQVMELPKVVSKSGSDSRDLHYNGHDSGLNRDLSADAAGNINGAASNVGALAAEAGFTVGKFFSKIADSRFETKYDSRDSIASRYNRMDSSDYHSVITKDNVVMNIDAVVFYQITDPKQYAYGMKKPLAAMQKLTITTLRNIIGTMDLDETLCSRDVINTKLRAALDEATDAWGVKINRVEIEDIVPPADLQAAMHHQAMAERERRALVLSAEGEKTASILRAEGQAEANRLMNETAPVEAILKQKAIEAMPKIADGQSNTVIIPSEIQGVVGLAKGVVEAVKQ